MKNYFGIGAFVALICVAQAVNAQSTIMETFQTEFFENNVVPGKVSITLTDHEDVTITPFVETEIPGYVSFPGRPKFDARTGGANAQQDVGPLSFSYDDNGTVTNVTYPIEPLGMAPGPMTLTNVEGSGPALSGDGFIRVADNVNSLNNNVAWDTAYNGNISSMTANFQIRLQAGTAANDNADGFGFMYINEDPHGSSGALYTAGEEPSGTGLGVGFDIWDNGTEGPNSVSLHYDGQLIGSVDVTASNANREAYLESGMPIDVTIEAVPGFGEIVDPVLIPMSSFATSVTRSPANGGQIPMLDMDMGPGVQDAYYRLSSEVNDQGNYLTFDAVENGGSRPGFGARTGGANESHDIDNVKVDYSLGEVNAKFDFRITKNEGAPADGLGFVLARTVDKDNNPVHGTEGVVDRLTGEGWDVAEDPNLTQSFGLGFKTFEADELRLRYDGQVVANIPADALPDSFVDDTFVDGLWHSAEVTVVDIDGTMDATVTVSLDDTIVFSDTVAGAAGLGLVPEPSSAALMGTAALIGGLACRRRRRRS